MIAGTNSSGLRKQRSPQPRSDPDHKLMLDTNFFNNSFVEQPQKANPKIMAYWMIVCQWFGQILSWLA